MTPTRQWPTRIAAETECLQILRHSGYSVGARVTNPDHIAVLSGLVAIHPHSAEKTGSGIDFFTIEQMAGTPGQTVSSDSIGFVIHHVDGRKVDFSYVEAIYPSDQKRRVTNALKAEIDDLRLQFRDSRFAGGSAKSDVSGNPFARRSDASVIYDNPSFSQLAYRFAESEGGWNAIDVESGASNAFIGDALIDPAVRQRWRDFFGSHARLQLATRSEGASRPRANETAWTP
ncbi:DCL family protein [Microbacterium fluvii]|uniref:DCL family protein n=1 Tax=Microbacterium fluvii TaxID=415215 RepID=A0ABW2HAS6_9MICO|nr:DCL family protein [Microbacterium fluvii]MCU4671805.1 DCL family protein [Microbacterium fluvii]